MNAFRSSWVRTTLVAFATLLIVMATGVSRAADQTTSTMTCVKAPSPITVAYAHGDLSIAYQICFDITNVHDFTWQGSIVYDQADWGGGFNVDGTVDVEVTFVNDRLTSVALTGGPVVYTVGGRTYDAVFNNLTFNFSNGLTSSGTVTINGTVSPAQAAYWELVYH